MRKIFLFLGCLLCMNPVPAQKSINKLPINELELNTNLSAVESDLFLITGEEDIYANNPNLRENVHRNIANGIREGLYAGNEFGLVNGIMASRITLFFYNEELYKVRWFFLQEDYSDLSDKSSKLVKFLENKYGIPDEQIPQILRVWQGKKRYVQTFSEETEFQIEYRDEKIHKVVEKLKE
ncbi:MAG: hypothetical protein RIM99_02445 [Cyclobacteriaceae bacterium]